MGRTKKPKYEPKPWEHITTYRGHNGQIDNQYNRIYASMEFSPAMKHLSSEGYRLYHLVKAQYRDRPDQPNGTVKCPYAYLRKCGMGSKGTISDHFIELERFGFLEIAFQGGRGRPNVYKLSDKWKTITEEEAKQIKQTWRKSLNKKAKKKPK